MKLFIMDIDTNYFLLHSLVLDNFKCFSAQTVIGPFEKFNSIVGPNGTGKSTILEALSFILCKDLILGGKFDYSII